MANDSACPPHGPCSVLHAACRDFTRSTSRVVTCQRSADGETSKLLLELQDGMQVRPV